MTTQTHITQARRELAAAVHASADLPLDCGTYIDQRLEAADRELKLALAYLGTNNPQPSDLSREP